LFLINFTITFALRKKLLVVKLSENSLIATDTVKLETNIMNTNLYIINLLNLVVLRR